MADVLFRPFRPGDETAFRELNEAWIERHFAMEDADRKALNDPHGYVLASGGAIVMAEQDGVPVGTCALLAMGDGRFELAKMTVMERLQGLGIGRKLLAFVIEHARQMGAKSLFLETNHTLVNAIHLYEALGFRHLPAERRHASPYARSDVQMELIFE
jgi:ribosomal protein S18 acetylase RimI-like enzyme